MAVVPMKRLELYGLKNQRKAVLDLLQRRGVVEVGTARSVEGGFSQSDTSQKQQELEQASALLEQAVALVNQYAPSKKGVLSFLAGRAPISQEEYETGGETPPRSWKKPRAWWLWKSGSLTGTLKSSAWKGSWKAYNPGKLWIFL